MKAEAFSQGRSKRAADGVGVEAIHEVNILNGQGYCHAVEEGGIASEGGGATERLECTARETTHQHNQEDIVRGLLRAISLLRELARTGDRINMTS